MTTLVPERRLPRGRGRRWLALATVLAVVVAACGDDGGAPSRPAGPDGRRSVTLMLNWTPNAHHLGIYVAQARGYYEEVGIDLEVLEPSLASTTEQVVGAGQADFGVSIAESVLPARASGVPIVSIATILPVNDSALMSLPEDEIGRPRDLAGKTYGGFGGALERQLVDRLIRCDDGDPSTLDVVEVGNVDYLAGLEADRFDVVWIFEGWDGLRAERIEDVDVDYLRFSDHTECIPNWYTPLLIAGEDVLDGDPELVRDFLTATERGYRDAIDEPAEAAASMLELVPELDEELLDAAAEYYAPRFAPEGRFGFQDAEEWSSFAAFLAGAGLEGSDHDVESAWTNEYLPT